MARMEVPEDWDESEAVVAAIMGIGHQYLITVECHDDDEFGPVPNSFHVYVNGPTGISHLHEYDTTEAWRAAMEWVSLKVNEEMQDA